MGLVGLRPQNFMLSHFLPSSPPSLLAIFCSFPLKPYHPRRLCGCDDMTKKNPMKWSNPRFANPETKQPLLTRRLSQPPDAFKQRAPRGFLSSSHFICQKCFQTTSFFNILIFAKTFKQLSNNELLKVFLPSSHFYHLHIFLTILTLFYHPHIYQDFHFLNQVPTIAFRQLRELDHVNLNQVIKTSSFLNLFYFGPT